MGMMDLIRDELGPVAIRAAGTILRVGSRGLDKVFGAEHARGEFTSSAYERMFSNRLIPKKGTRQLLEAYSDLPPLRSITNRIGQSMASTIWTPFRVTNPKRTRLMARRLTTGEDLAKRDKEVSRRKQLGEIEELDHHPVLDLLENPNKAMTGRAFMLLHQVTMELVGENFWIVETDGQGIPRELLSIPPSWVTVVPNPLADDGFFMIRWPSGLETAVPAGNMIWFRDPDPANPYDRGVGTAGALSDELSTDEQAAKVALQRFINGGSPEMLVGISGLSDEQVIEFQDRFREDYRGWMRTALPWITNGEIKVEKLGMSFADMDLIDQRKATQAIIRETWGLPPEILGIIENSNRATIEASMFLYTSLTITPRQVQLASDLNVNLMPRYRDNALLLPESQVPEDKAHKLTTMKALPAAFNEAQWQETAGFVPPEDEDGGNLHFIPMGLEVRPLVPPEGEEEEEEIEIIVDEPDPEPEPPEPPELDEDGEAKAVLTVPTVLAVTASSAPEWFGSEPVPILPLKCEVVEIRKDPVDDRVDAIVERLKAEAMIVEVSPIWERRLRQWIERSIRDLGVEPNFGLINPVVVEHLNEFAGDRITFMVVQPQLDRLAETLVEGFRAGESIDKITKRVQDVFGDIEKWRARRIARTEVLRSSNFGSWKAMQLSGIIDMKEWIGTPDDRVRDDHDPAIIDSLDGQVQQINNPFVIVRAASKDTGATAMHPGDFGIGSQDVNCRCTTAAVIPDPLEDEEPTTRTAEEREAIWREFDAHAEAWETEAEKAIKRASRIMESQMIQILEEAFPSAPE